MEADDLVQEAARSLVGKWEQPLPLPFEETLLKAAFQEVAEARPEAAFQEEAAALRVVVFQAQVVVARRAVEAVCPASGVAEVAT